MLREKKFHPVSPLIVFNLELSLCIERQVTRHPEDKFEVLYSVTVQLTWQKIQSLHPHSQR